MRKKIITAILAVMMSVSLVPTSVPVMAQEMAVEQNNDAATKSFTSVGARFYSEEPFSAKTYSGVDLMPTFQVVDKDGYVIDSTNYDVAWTDSQNKSVSGPITNAGTYKVTVTGKGAYSGTLTHNFTVDKASVSITFPNQSPYAVAYNNGDPVDSYPVGVVQKGGNVGDITEKTTYKSTANPVYSESEIAPKAPGTYSVSVSVTIPAEKKNNYVLKSSTPNKDGSYTVASGTGSFKINHIDLNNYNISLSTADKTKSPNEITYTTGDILKEHPIQFFKKTDPGTAVEIAPSHYTISPASNKGLSLGTHTITVSAKANDRIYTGSTSYTFNVVKATSTTGKAFKGYIEADPTLPTKTWTGSPITLTNQELVVYYTGDGKKTKLTPGTDYTVAYDNNTNVGQATVKITGAGAYRNETDDSLHFTITKKPLSLSMVKIGNTNLEYTGKALDPKITLVDGSKTLKAGTDYSVTYPNLTAAGKDKKVTITALAVSSYTGTILAKITIKPHTIKDSEVQLSTTAVTVENDGKTAINSSSISGKLPTVTYTYDRIEENNLNASTSDFDITYNNISKAGTANVTIEGKGNYTGKVVKNFTIDTVNPNAADLSAAGMTKIADISAVTYNGTQQKPSVTVRYNSNVLRNGTDYRVIYGSNTEVGTGSVTVTGINGYKGSISKNFDIKPANISVVSVGSIPSQAYTGGQITPALTLSYAGQTLREGTDYRAYYSNNVNKGTATARIQGLRNFTGETTRTFSIVDKKDLDKEIYATAFTLPDEVSVTAGGTVSITASLTPANANKYSIRWSTSSASFPFSDGLTAETKENTPSIEVKGGKEGSAVITATLYGENNKEIGTAYTLVKIEKRFDDVSSSTYYSTAVDALANYGYTTGSGASREFHATPVVNGNTTTTYNPAGPVTRGQFVTMMYNKAVADYKAGKSTTDPSKAAASGFSDVGSSAYYASAVNWASANGIAQGTSASTFNPNGTVTRAEAVTFLQRWLGGASGTSSQFSDVASSSYYSGAVGWAVKNGVTNGTSATTFEPGTKCNRGQAATFIYRAAF